MRTFFRIPHDTKIDVIGLRRPAAVFSGILLALAILATAVFGLNFGIDFRGGILLEVETEGPADLGALRGTLGGLDLGDVSLQEFGADDTVLIRIQRQDGDETEQQAAIQKVKETLGDTVTYRRTEFVGPQVGQELIRAGITAVVLAIGAMLIYIWFRFEWQFAVGAVAALMHDVIATIGLFAILQLDFNLSTVAAVLTIAGYSINDTVVVYDRVRETLRQYKVMPLREVLNLAVNRTLSRTLLTSVTTLLALLALFLFGGAVIRGFTTAMIWGVVIGTYSSIFVAVGLLMRLGLERPADSAPEAGDASEAHPS